MSCGLVDEVSFAQIATRLREINKDFAEALERACAETTKKRGPSLRFYIAKYPYASCIVDRGRFRPPCNHRSCDDCSRLLEECSYSHIPLAAILTNSVEVSLDGVASGAHSSSAVSDSTGTVMLRVLRKGDLFGVFETLHTLLRENEAPPPWSV